MKHNWHRKGCTKLMYIAWWVGREVHMCEDIPTIYVINKALKLLLLSCLGCLWIMLQLALECRYLFKTLIPMYIIRSMVAGLNGILIFNFLRNIHTVFQNVCTKLHSHQVHKGSFFSIFSPVLDIFFFLLRTIPTDMSWYFISLKVILIYISLMRK